MPLARWVQDGSDKRNAFQVIPKSNVCRNRSTKRSATCPARSFSTTSVGCFWPKVTKGVTEREMNKPVATNFRISRDEASKMPNAALERLAHATTNKGYSPASPLQALVGLRVGMRSYDCHTRLFDNKRHLPFSCLSATCHPSVNVSPNTISTSAVLLVGS